MGTVDDNKENLYLQIVCDYTACKSTIKNMALA